MYGLIRSCALRTLDGVNGSHDVGSVIFACSVRVVYSAAGVDVFEAHPTGVYLLVGTRGRRVPIAVQVRCGVIGTFPAISYGDAYAFQNCVIFD